MPATITHAYFAKDLYDLLSDEERKKIPTEKKSLMMFAQGSDPFMFYHTINLKKTKKIMNLQKIVHEQKVDLFFGNLIHYIKKNNYQNDPTTMAFLYGMICHHTLDSSVHPLVHYKTGIFKKENKKTYQYNGGHTIMEAYIDNYMLSKNNEKKINLKKFCFDFYPLTEEAKDTINYTFESTFEIKDAAKIYMKSLKQMEMLLSLLRLDHHGYKKKIYQLIDYFTSTKTFKLSPVSYYQKESPKKDYLNKAKNTWNYPIDKKIKSNKSFDELYKDSLLQAKKVIEEVNSYLNKNKEINIHQLFQNKSYTTGVNCNDKRKQKYFEF